MNDIITFDNTIKLLVGTDVINDLPYNLSLKNCEKVMIVCDEIAFRLGYVDMVKNVFTTSPIDIVYIYKKIGDVATDKDVEEIARMYRYYKCDSIIAIGRKASILAAKGAKLLIVESVRYLSHYVANPISEYPTNETCLVCVPINFGSGYEALPLTRVYDKEHNKIYEVTSQFSSTDILVLETRMSDIIPPKAIATYGLFALSLALECYKDDETPMLSKAYADAAIDLVYKYLIKCMFKNADMLYRQKIMEAVGYASCAYASIKKNNLLAPLSDIISDRYLANSANIYAILFRKYIPTVKMGRAFGYAINSMVDSNDYALYAKEARIQKTLAQVEDLYLNVEKCVDFNARLRDFGIKEEDLQEIADEFQRYNEDESLTNEVVLTLLRAAY